jgi:hypothetical protein
LEGVSFKKLNFLKLLGADLLKFPNFKVPFSEVINVCLFPNFTGVLYEVVSQRRTPVPTICSVAPESITKSYLGDGELALSPYTIIAACLLSWGFDKPDPRTGILS